MKGSKARSEYLAYASQLYRDVLDENVSDIIDGEITALSDRQLAERLRERGIPACIASVYLSRTRQQIPEFRIRRKQGLRPAPPEERGEP